MNKAIDPVDAIMLVMREAFDPAFGEAWTYRQISDALVLPGTHYHLAVADAATPAQDAKGINKIQGFTLSRHIADEEELLLIGVRPCFRRQGIGRQLMSQFCCDATNRGARNLFLEMREGNEAEVLYRSFGFTCVGRRKDYYRNTKSGPIDAITFKLTL